MTSEKIKIFLQEQYGKKALEIKKFKAGVLNDNYLVKTEKGNYVFRIYNFKNKEQVGFEAELLEFLKKNNFLSPKLLADNYNELISNFDNKPCIFYEFIEGEQLKNITPEIMGQIGEVMAKLHNLSKNFQPLIKKSTWEPKELKKIAAENKDKMLNSGFPRGKELMDFTEAELAKYSFPETLPKGITHQDIKPENIIVKDNKIAGIVDFDNSYIGAFLHDITTTIIWTCFENNNLNESLMKELLKGYEKERKLTEEEKKYLLSGIKFRLAREVFIGPFVTMHLPELSRERADYFINLYNNLNI
jgi:homoserine kinase type II